jgi:hypothetical protein
MTDTRNQPLTLPEIIRITETRIAASLRAAAGTDQGRRDTEDLALYRLLIASHELNLDTAVLDHDPRFNLTPNLITTPTPTTSTKGPIPQ